MDHSCDTTTLTMCEGHRGGTVVPAKGGDRMTGQPRILSENRVVAHRSVQAEKIPHPEVLNVFSESWKLMRYCGTFNYYNLLATQETIMLINILSPTMFSFFPGTLWPECLQTRKLETLSWVSGWGTGPRKTWCPHKLAPTFNALSNWHKSYESIHIHHASYSHLISFSKMTLHCPSE